MSTTEIARSTGVAVSDSAHTEGKPSGFEAAYPSKTALAVKLLAFYIFLVVSRVLDVSPIWFLHIPMILLITLILSMFFRGDLRTIFSSNISRWFIGFTVWVVLCLPLSTWRGTSLHSVQEALQALAIFLIIVQTVKNESEWRKITGAYAYAVLVASLLSFVLGRMVEGRISLLNGSLADPNEFALILVVGLPFWWLKASRSGGPRKIFSLLCTIPIFIVFARTGSRSGLIALCALFGVVMLFAKPAQKLLIAMLAVCVVAGGALFLPEYLKVRFTTLFTRHAEDRLDWQTRERLAGDIGSSEGREMLLIQSIKMTFEHPVFGVGPGVFASASWDERKNQTGSGGTLLVSHNTYTQISSETGLPGFFLFVTTLGLCLTYAVSDYRRAKRINPDLAKNEFYLLASLTALSVGIFFLSVGYTHTLAVMFALSACLHRIPKESEKKKLTETDGSGLEVPAKGAPVIRAKTTPQAPVPEVRNPGRFRSLRRF
ncbi:MAG: O-antigen ligase family protein [Acidobacteriaceae bacterium]|nr:O-antigen ligase family protein [Acidobacteriaceae bacterium]